LQPLFLWLYVVAVLVILKPDNTLNPINSKNQNLVRCTKH